MEDKIINTTEEISKMDVDLTHPITKQVIKTIKVDAKTTYTHYESGRKDCAIVLIKPLGIGGTQVPLN